MPEFEFPAIHSFAPFYTRQPNLDTFAAQKQQWAAIILLYHKQHKRYCLRLGSEALSTDLFSNRSINRTLKLETLKEIVEYMVTQSQAEYTTKKKDEVLVYWRRPEDWAQDMVSYISDTGQNGSVLTIYELTEAEEAQNSAFYGMDKQMFRKIIDVLSKKGKAAIMKSSEGDEVGIKFT